MNINHFSVKGIINNNLGDYSYAHSVLQALSCLDSSNYIAQNLPMFKIDYNPNFYLTTATFQLIDSLNKGKECNSQYFMQCYINAYEKNKSIIQIGNVLFPDPFHFLYFLLQFLHLETNIPENPNYQIRTESLLNQKNDQYMFELYKDFWNQTQHSIISNFFITIIRYIIDCPNCGQYFSYGMKNLFRINVDTAKYFRDKTYPDKINSKINLDDCITCYVGGYKKKCLNCINENTYRYTRIIIPAKVLIIVLERKIGNRNYMGDVYFEQNLDIKKFVSTTRVANINSKYILKACISCISYDNINIKYFADCYLKNQEGNWYRFMDGKKEKLYNFEEIYKYEPQVLIYELNDNYGQINNNNNKNNNINYFIINNNNNLINNNNNFNNNIINNNNNFNNNINNNNFINNNNNLNNNLFTIFLF